MRTFLNDIKIKTFNMELSAKYEPQEIEKKWYDYWTEHKFFHSEPDNR